jgi:hypothetical protein
MTSASRLPLPQNCETNAPPSAFRPASAHILSASLLRYATEDTIAELTPLPRTTKPSLAPPTHPTGWHKLSVAITAAKPNFSNLDPQPRARQ